MLVLELYYNQLFGMHVKRLSPMKEMILLLINHVHIGNSRPINNSNGIPIYICNNSHEPFEVGFNDVIV